MTDPHARCPFGGDATDGDGNSTGGDVRSAGPEPDEAEVISGEVPGPPPVSVLGWRANAVRFFRNPIAYVAGLHSAFGSVARLVRGNNRPLFADSRMPASATYFAFGGRCNRQILSDDEVFQTRTPPGPPTRAYAQLATNLLFTNGGRHDEHRKLMMPAFTRDSLKKYHGTMVEYGEAMLRDWRGKASLDLYREMNRVALRIGSRCFYGLDPSREGQQLAVRMTEMHTLLFSPAALVPLDLPGTPYRKLLRSMQEIVDGLLAEIEAKRAAGSDGEDIMSMMVRAHDRDPGRLTLDELLGNGFLLYFAGHETTFKALTWTLFLLAMHPEVAADLLDELEEHLGGDPPAYDQLYRLPLLDRVIKESLRLFPPASLLPRVATRSARLGGYAIPAGSEVIWSPYVTHRDAEVYREPQRFLPERWLEISPSPFEYVPFGARSRTCMGVSFAGMELRILIPMILQRHRLQVAPGARIDLQANTVMGPRPGIPVTVHPQDRDFRPPAPVKGYVREMVDLG